MLTIRKAGINDLAAITDIYNEAISNTTATFDTSQKSMEEQTAWFNKHGSRYPVLVAVEDKNIKGWASLSAWSDRYAYADTAEASIYVKAGERGKGVGRRLSEEIIKAGREAGLHTLILRIGSGNDASIRLAESMGFEHIGVMREVGKKFGRLLDVYLMQLIYK